MARYSDEVIDEVRHSNDIVDVISQYVHLKRSGRNYFGLCPFHSEKSPSFSVSPDKQIFHCFGCGVGGNVFTFVSKIEGLGFFDTIQMLAERGNIQLPALDNNFDAKKEKLKEKVYKVNEFAAEFYHQNLYKPNAKIGQEYVKKRKLSNETLKAYKIGFSGTTDELYKELKKQGFEDEEILETGLVNKNSRGQYIDRFRNRLMFPICDVRGRFIAFGGRVLDDSKPKYINSPENIVYSKSRHLYGLNVAKKGEIKELIAVEGYMDVISLHQRGITNVVAPLGTAFTEQQGWLISRGSTEKIILSFDSDDAGLKAKLRAIDILQKMGCDIRIIELDGAKDPDEYIIKFGNLRFKNAVDKAISVIEFKVKILEKDLNINNSVDKIKFLNEIAKLLSSVDNTIEREVYIENIAKKYNISKEAIYAEVNKIKYKSEKHEKNLERKIPIIVKGKTETKNITTSVKNRENTIIALLLMGETFIYEVIKQNINNEEIQDDINKNIISALYNDYEKGNININRVIDSLKDDEQNRITAIMAEDYKIDNIEKAIDDILQTYEKEKLESRKEEILEILKQTTDNNEYQKLLKELNELSKLTIKNRGKF